MKSDMVYEGNIWSYHNNDMHVTHRWVHITCFEHVETFMGCSAYTNDLILFHQCVAITSSGAIFAGDDDDDDGLIVVSDDVLISDMSSSHSSAVTLRCWIGNEYIGTVTSGSNTGTFTLNHPDGRTNVYIGEYSNGNFSGKGLWKGFSGNSYECEWRDSQVHGMGVYTHPNGCRELQEYNHDKHTKIISRGVCRCSCI